MKNIYLILLLFFSFQSSGFSQCRNFAEEIKTKHLSSEGYQHDGNYNAIIMEEGQVIEINKVFGSGYNYRMVIAGTANFPYIEFEVLNQKREILYTNRDNDYDTNWDFRADISIPLTIVIRVPDTNPQDPKNAEGCVTALFGLK